MLPDETRPAASSRSSNAERRLAIAGAALFGTLLLVSAGLWVRHGEEIFFSRIVTAIASCL
ncbi:MAG: hypothetical protein R3D57_13470 [Hyphomicrobiaceae bacterium]